MAIIVRVSCVKRSKISELRIELPNSAKGPLNNEGDEMMRMIGAQAIILAFVMALCGRVDQASPRFAEAPAFEKHRRIDRHRCGVAEYWGK
jgi:hypothetical protein